MGLLNFQKDYPVYRKKNKKNISGSKSEGLESMFKICSLLGNIEKSPVFFPELLSIHPRNGTCQCFMLCQKVHFAWLWHRLFEPVARVSFYFALKDAGWDLFAISFSPRLQKFSSTFWFIPFLLFPAFISPPLLPSRPSLSFLLQCAVPPATVLITLHVSASLYFCHPAPGFFFAALPVIC